MLRTKRLTLRLAEPSDLVDMHAFMGDPRAMAYWDTPPHPDISTTKALLEKMVSKATSRLSLYFVFEHQTRVIGMGGLHGKNEIGYILHPDFWRQGFLTEAMGELLPHIWENTKNDHLFAEVDPRNEASIGLLGSLGFRETHRSQRTHLISGAWTDSIFFRLDRP